MTTKVLRKIVKIDEELCDGCGACVPSCVEGAIDIIDGKARLISESYCDGLGACLGECPRGAITIEERVSTEFDEEEVKLHLQSRNAQPSPPIFFGCPSATVAQFETPTESPTRPASGAPVASRLGHWPVQLALVHPRAPFLQGADLLLTADCVGFAHPDFHRELLAGHALLVACPKLDDFGAHQARLAAILREADVKSLTVVHMEVPCCSGLAYMAQQALAASGKDIPFKEITVGIKGSVLAG